MHAYITGHSLSFTASETSGKFVKPSDHCAPTYHDIHIAPQFLANRELAGGAWSYGLTHQVLVPGHRHTVATTAGGYNVDASLEKVAPPEVLVPHLGVGVWVCHHRNLVLQTAIHLCTEQIREVYVWGYRGGVCMGV